MTSCNGRGTHALHGIAITADEWHGPDWDDDSREAYLRGDYDTTCECCGGKRVVLVPDRERATVEQLKARNDARRQITTPRKNACGKSGCWASTDLNLDA